MAEKIDPETAARMLLDGMRDLMERHHLDRMTVGRAADELVGIRPFPKKPEPPRVPPTITASIYRNIVRGTS